MKDHVPRDHGFCTGWWWVVIVPLSYYFPSSWTVLTCLKIMSKKIPYLITQLVNFHYPNWQRLNWPVRLVTSRFSRVPTSVSVTPGVRDSVRSEETPDPIRPVVVGVNERIRPINGTTSTRIRRLATSTNTPDTDKPGCTSVYTSSFDSRSLYCHQSHSQSRASFVQISVTKHHNHKV